MNKEHRGEAPLQPPIVCVVKRLGIFITYILIAKKESKTISFSKRENRSRKKCQKSISLNRILHYFQYNDDEQIFLK